MKYCLLKKTKTTENQRFENVGAEARGSFAKEKNSLFLGLFKGQKIH